MTQCVYSVLTLKNPEFFLINILLPIRKSNQDIEKSTDGPPIQTLYCIF